MKKVIWTKTEEKYLINGLKKGESLSSIMSVLPRRTRGAVLHKANTLFYGYDTEPNTREVHFRPYIKHITRRTKLEIEMEISNGSN